MTLFARRQDGKLAELPLQLLQHDFLWIFAATATTATTATATINSTAKPTTFAQAQAPLLRFSSNFRKSRCLL
ncbi:GM10498 [Drosophila sechellia]|uniref:GM10498 n=1 Tax=Drosophila sechellia TaxID=7238 RepID=B4I4Q7_DROSE|nr:GM10498 [Drosophila sechellia]